MVRRVFDVWDSLAMNIDRKVVQVGAKVVRVGENIVACVVMLDVIICLHYQ